MTELIHSQIVIIAVMMCCGIGGGLIHSTFKSFENRKKMKNPLKVIWIVLGFLCLGLGTIGIVLFL